MLAGNLHKTQVTLQPQTSRGAQDRSRATRPVGLGTRPPHVPHSLSPGPHSLVALRPHCPARLLLRRAEPFLPQALALPLTCAVLVTQHGVGARCVFAEFRVMRKTGVANPLVLPRLLQRAPIGQLPGLGCRYYYFF